MSSLSRPNGDLGSSDVTRLLREWRAGAEGAQDALFEHVYADLRRLAARFLRNERDGHTLAPTGLVHEAYLRLGRERSPVQAENRLQFFAVAARAMRRILVEHARYHAAGRRYSSRDALPLDERMPGPGDESTLLEILAVDEALERLRETNERQAKVVELRYFAGLEESEVASLLGVSRATVSRDWRVARLVLQRHLRSGGS